MQPLVYVETSVISYLTARPSRDLRVAARQEATRERWELRGQLSTPAISRLVLQEASAGNPEAALRRMEVCAGLTLLPLTAACEGLAQQLIAAKVIPDTEQEDALHIALATLQQAEFIASWNFAHLVGPVAKFRLQSRIKEMGYAPPILATPEELLEIGV